MQKDSSSNKITTVSVAQVTRKTEGQYKRVISVVPKSSPRPCFPR